MIVGSQFELLSASDWRARMDAHRARAGRHTVPARHRRDRGLPHPIADFLFEYEGEQKALSIKAQTLRQRLIGAIAKTLGLAG
jgi:hypothetical protein